MAKYLFRNVFKYRRLTDLVMELIIEVEVLIVFSYLQFKWDVHPAHVGTVEQSIITAVFIMDMKCRR